MVSSVNFLIRNYTCNNGILFSRRAIKHICFWHHFLVLKTLKSHQDLTYTLFLCFRKYRSENLELYHYTSSIVPLDLNFLLWMFITSGRFEFFFNILLRKLFSRHILRFSGRFILPKLVIERRDGLDDLDDIDDEVLILRLVWRWKNAWYSDIRSGEDTGAIRFRQPQRGNHPCAKDIKSAWNRYIFLKFHKIKVKI